MQFKPGDYVNHINGIWENPERIARIQSDPAGDIAFFVRGGFHRVSRLKLWEKSNVQPS